MTNDTIFRDLSINRYITRWEDYLFDLTPVERHGGMLFKREDKFAPLGYGGLNGSKLRQCIFLLGQYSEEVEGGEVISASSVKSPQISMSTAVARHYGMPTTHIIGATNPASALKHPNVGIAARLGARFIINPVAYNPALQRALDRLAAERPQAYRLEYGISLPESASDEAVAAFHMIGARQVRNLPTVNRLIIPAGSCVTTVSILLGLALWPADIFQVNLVGIGPNRIEWIERRLEKISRALNTTIGDAFTREYPDEYRRVQDTANLLSNDGGYYLHYEDLHGTGQVSYQQEVPYEYEGIEFHPTYEGKVMSHIAKHHPEWMSDGESCFWIVGSRPSWDAMKDNLPPIPQPSELVVMV
jgi:1-aminocyclopropane-1-carboxylate deaminase/D-cysteine desulfhydrase-like pyridoxal-dependent ACC family enzyme